MAGKICTQEYDHEGRNFTGGFSDVADVQIRTGSQTHFGRCGLGLACSQTSYAAGFALIEQSVPDMGTAYAGSAATADSLDTLYFNPAGMTQLPGTRAAAAVHLIEPTTEFDNEGTTYVTGAPIQGGDGGDAGGLAAVPHFYLTHQMDDKTWLGLAVNAPFGLTTEYTATGWAATMPSSPR